MLSDLHNVYATKLSYEKRLGWYNRAMANANDIQGQKTILILHASTGSGHKVCAQSIAGALEDIIKYDVKGEFSNCKVVVRDILDFLL